MFVLLSVAGVVVIIILSGIFIPDEIFQRIAEEFQCKYSDENGNKDSEAIKYWRNALQSLDITLAVSTGLGTILTTFLFYRLSQDRLASLVRRFNGWMWKKENTQVEVIMRPDGLIFQTDSKECLLEEFHEAADDFLVTSSNDQYGTAEGKGDSDCSENITSNSAQENDKEISTNLTEFDEISKAPEKIMCRKLNDNETEYQTLEARLVAEESGLCQDVDSRMNIFEQQLEEFRTKMRPGLKIPADNFKLEISSKSDLEIFSKFKRKHPNFYCELEIEPSECELEAVETTSENAVPSIQRSPSRNLLKSSTDQMDDIISDNASRGESSSGILTRGESFYASDTGSETVSEHGSVKKSSIPTSLHVIRKKGTCCQRRNLITPDTRSDPAMKRKELATVNQQMNNVTSKKSIDNSSSRSSSNKPIQPATRSRQQFKSIVLQTNEELPKRPSNKYLVMKLLESAPKNQQMSCVLSKTSSDNSPSQSSSNHPNRRSTRQRQQFKSILKQTNEELSQRPSNKYLESKVANHRIK